MMQWPLHRYVTDLPSNFKFMNHIDFCNISKLRKLTWMKRRTAGQCALLGCCYIPSGRADKLIGIESPRNVMMAPKNVGTKRAYAT